MDIVITQEVVTGALAGLATGAIPTVAFTALEMSFAGFMGGWLGGFSGKDFLKISGYFCVPSTAAGAVTGALGAPWWGSAIAAAAAIGAVYAADIMRPSRRAERRQRREDDARRRPV